MIETTRLILRPMRREDVDAFLCVFTDPRVMASFGGTLFNRLQMEQWVERNLEHQDRYGYGLFTVILRESGPIIGDCGLEHLSDYDPGEAELGYDIRSDHWRHGFATEAATLGRDYAFHGLGLHRLVSLIRQGNDASRRVAEKTGVLHASDVARHGQRYWLFATGRLDAGRQHEP